MPHGEVAVVLPGGGARGAYEVGAMSVLLDALERRGKRVSTWCGTSVGAINETLFASLADEPAQQATDQGQGAARPRLRAKRWLRRHPSFWCRDAAHDLSFGDLDHGRVSDQQALDEYRALRRI